MFIRNIDYDVKGKNIEVENYSFYKSSATALSRDAKMICDVDQDGITIIDLTNKEVHQLPGHVEGTTCVRFSDDGKMLSVYWWK